MYAKQTQTDAVCVKDKVSDDEGEEETAEPSRDLQAAGLKGGHKDDTIEPEKQVHTTCTLGLPLGQACLIVEHCTVEWPCSVVVV